LEVSAKNATNVEKAFVTMVSEIKGKDKVAHTRNVKIESTPVQTKSSFSGYC
jgi:hypothetical protein